MELFRTQRIAARGGTSEEYQALKSIQALAGIQERHVHDCLCPSFILSGNPPEHRKNLIPFPELVPKQMTSPANLFRLIPDHFGMIVASDI